MKELKSKTMKAFLTSGLRKAKISKRPSEGCMYNLIYKTLSNGWHYQIDYIYDLRACKKPYVAVYAFKPPLDYSARMADYYLMKEV